jgi:hypothetical protein
MKRAALSVLAALCLISAATPAWPITPFSYQSATSWCDQTVKTDIPKAQRVDILGPDKSNETYLLNNKPAIHQVEFRRIVRYKQNLTIETILEQVKLDKRKYVSLELYRAGTQFKGPLISMGFEDGLEGFGLIPDGSVPTDFPLSARDVVLIKYVPPPSQGHTPPLIQ